MGFSLGQSCTVRELPLYTVTYKPGNRDFWDRVYLSLSFWDSCLLVGFLYKHYVVSLMTLVATPCAFLQIPWVSFVWIVLCLHFEVGWPV